MAIVQVRIYENQQTLCFHCSLMVATSWAIQKYKAGNEDINVISEPSSPQSSTRSRSPSPDDILERAAADVKEYERENLNTFEASIKAKHNLIAQEKDGNVRSHHPVWVCVCVLAYQANWMNSVIRSAPENSWWNIFDSFGNCSKEIWSGRILRKLCILKVQKQIWGKATSVQSCVMRGFLIFCLSVMCSFSCWLVIQSLVVSAPCSIFWALQSMWIKHMLQILCFTTQQSTRNSHLLRFVVACVFRGQPEEAVSSRHVYRVRWYVCCRLWRKHKPMSTDRNESWKRWFWLNLVPAECKDEGCRCREGLQGEPQPQGQLDWRWRLLQWVLPL